MYRSRLELDRLNHSVRQGIKNCHDMHRTLMRAFPNCSREEAGMLYRLIDRGNECLVYMQSVLSPKLELLKENGITPCEKARCIDELSTVLKQGRDLQFNLLTYPFKKLAVEGAANSKRVFLADAGDRATWLSRKGEQNGFAILAADEKRTINIQGRKTGARIDYCAVEFEGWLRITDPRAFFDGYSKGIGAGKAYGLGLLMIKGS